MDVERDEKYLRNYVDYRIPAKVRECLTPFAAWLDYKMEDRMPRMQEAINKDNRMVDPLSEFLVERSGDMRAALQKVLGRPVELTVAGRP